MFKQARKNQADADRAIINGEFGHSAVYEADKLAIRALAYHGYAPKGYVSAVKKLFSKGPLKKPHPSPQKRVTRILKQVKRCFPWHKELALGKERYLNEVIEKLD